MNLDTDTLDELQRIIRHTDRLSQNLAAYGDTERSAIMRNPTQLAKYVGELTDDVSAIARALYEIARPEEILPTDDMLQARADHNKKNAHALFPNLVEFHGRWHRPTSVAWDKVTGSGLVPVVFTPYGYADDPDA